MRWAARWWHGLVSVLVAAGVGVVTNLATDGFPWALTAGLVALVIAQLALSLWQADQDHRARQTARDDLLAPLRSPMPALPASDRPSEGSPAEAKLVARWLTAQFSPTPLWGRNAVRNRLVNWCVERDPEAGVVRLVTGPAGVGKSRLALAVGESLLERAPGWAAGRLLGGAEVLVDRIVAAGDPTLVIVNDADRVPDLATVITRAMRYPRLVRLLLLVRTEASLRALPDELRTSPAEQLGPLGEATDRKRWFAEAVNAYAHRLDVRLREVPNLPVGTDDDTPLILHARALLAVLGRKDSRTWSFAKIVTELVRIEQRSWEADLPTLPVGCDVDVLAQVITVLLTHPVPTVEDAAEELRRVPQFAHDSAHESRFAVARWARRRYPPGTDHHLDLRPHLIAERLLVDTVATSPKLLLACDTNAAAAMLIRAYASFPDALRHLVVLLTHRRDDLPDVIATILDSGVTSTELDRELAKIIGAADITDNAELRTRLVDLDPSEAFPRLRVAHGELCVHHYRQLADAEPDQYRPDLAASLYDLGQRLLDVGRHRNGLVAAEESVVIWQALAEADPDGDQLDLALSLHVLSRALRTVGKLRDALVAAEKSVVILRALAEAEPDRHRPDLGESLYNLSECLWEVGRYREALAAAEKSVAILRDLAETESYPDRRALALSLHTQGVGLREVGSRREALAVTEEAVAIWRELAEDEPESYRPGLAMSLNNLSLDLREVEQHEKALAVIEEAVATWRELVEVEPDRHRQNLAMSLNNLGLELRAAGRQQEALAATKEAVAIWRHLAKAEPDRHRPYLALALHNLGDDLRELERDEEALATTEEAVAIWRELAEAEPDRHRADLALSLYNLGACLGNVGRHRDALVTADESVVIWRELTEVEPARYGPNLALALHNLSVFLEHSGGVESSLHVQRELVAVWKACADGDPEIFGTQYRMELTKLRDSLEIMGRREEALALGIDDTLVRRDDA